MKNRNYSKLVKMHPWEGDNYDTNHPKILILGESLYDKKIEKNTIIKMIKNLIEHENYAFFTKLEYIISKPEHWDSGDGVNYKLDREKFWNDISFYEYIQESLSGPKEKVPESYWINAKVPFEEVMNTLAPDIIVVLGYETYWNLPEGGKEGKVYDGKKNMITWKYTLKGGKKVFLCAFQHPSSFGFSSEQWIKHFGDFLEDEYNICYG